MTPDAKYRPLPSRRTWFAPREIAIRNAWGVRWIRLSRGAQVSALALGLAAFGWVSHTTIATLSRDSGGDGRDQTIALLQAELARQARLDGEVATLRAQRDAAEAARAVLEKQVTSRAFDRDEARPTNPALHATAPTVNDNSAALSLELSAAHDERRRLMESLQVAEDRLAAMESNAGATRELLAQAERRATTLKDRVVALEMVQGALVERLTPATAVELTSLEGQLGNTGLDLTRIVPTGGAGQGGPLVELAQAPPPPGSAAENPTSRDRLLLLTSSIVRLDTLRAALPAIPLTTPLSQYELRSSFGMRQDPFRRRAAFHAGLDFAAPLGTPVKVTAPGEVVDAGWEGAYGRAVRVRHAFGVETRYAHLRSISVKVGDTLETGDVVGKLGSSGRSTGPHVHYEVMLDDVPRDPIPFIEAGRHVQQTQDDK